MHMIYNSPSYCVVEFHPLEGESVASFEIVDKMVRRTVYLGGALAERFRDDVESMIAREPTPSEVDAWLSSFDELMQQPMTVH